MIRLLGVIFCLFFIISCGGGTGNNNSAESPNIYLAQSTIDFSGTVLNNYTDRICIIKNTGNSNLNIGQISQPAQPFTISSDTASNRSLAPNQTCSFLVRFSPVSQGPFTTTFSIPSNDPDSPTANITLQGEGYGLNVWINQINPIGSCPIVKINLDVTVTDSNGPLKSLTSANFIITQKNEQQTIQSVQLTDPYPVSVILALDLSGSMTADLFAIKNAAKDFIDQMDDEDEAAICRFRQAIDLSPLTATDINGKDTLKEDYIDPDFNVTDGTSLYDAVLQSINRLAVEGTKDKFAVIVLSDGVDTVGGKTLTDVISSANQKGIPVFTIFYVDLSYYPDATPDIMQQLARDTGGQYYNSSDKDDLAGILKQISNVLSNKYTIRYTSSICSGSEIPLEVRADFNGSYGCDSKTFDLP